MHRYQFAIRKDYHHIHEGFMQWFTHAPMLHNLCVSIRVSDPYDSISTLLDLPLLKSFQSSDVQALRRCCDLSPQGIENRGVPP